MKNWLYKESRKLHKYLGLVGVFYLVWMSLSGVLLNHPDLIKGLSVHQRLIPESYRIRNWNRSTLNRLVVDPSNPDVWFISGKAGVWKSTDAGRCFAAFNSGLPRSHYYRKTNTLHLTDHSAPVLFAGTDGGLFACPLAQNQWQPVTLGPQPEKIMRIVQVDERLLVFTPSHLYTSPGPTIDAKFNVVDIERFKDVADTTSLISLFFHLHDGQIWGLPGRLLFDLAALIIVFLALSGVYLWIFPKRRRRLFSYFADSLMKQNWFKWCFSYHLLMGICAALVIGIIAITGLFMRPPLIAAIYKQSISTTLYPGPLSTNPWHEKIQNAAYDPLNNRIVIQATDGFWAGSTDLQTPFEPLDLILPVFVMGATVFEIDDSGTITAGSFGGLFSWSSQTGETYDHVNQTVFSGSTSLRPADYLVTGLFTAPSGDQFITTHKQGVVHLDTLETSTDYPMPDELLTDYRMPLWNFLFELHNGRIFRDLLGAWHILITPLGALLLLIITLTGIYDWFVLKVFKRKH